MSDLSPDLTTPAGPVLEYSPGSTTLKPANLRLALFVVCCAIVTPVIGVMTLLLYGLTAADRFVEFGIWWLLIGGMICSITGLTSLCLTNVIKREAPSGPQARRRYAIVLTASILAFPVALGCVRLGVDWVVSPHFRLRVENTTGVDLDSVTVHFDGGDVTVGPVPKKGSVRSGLLWVHHQGPLYITTRVGDATQMKLDRISCGPWDLRGPVYDLQIESHELSH